MLRLLATISVLSLTLSGTVLAQTAPATPAPSSGDRAAFAERAATVALRDAYHTIADAEARGGTTYLDAAKTHYRNAIARLARHDAGAASEAMAAAALARASIVDHAVPAPHDIPAPPALPAGGPRPMMPRGPVAIGRGPAPQTGAPQMHGPPMGGSQMHGGFMHRGGPSPMAGRFDATRLAADAKLANTAEARDLAQKALDADIARTHAAFSGDMDEAMRQGRLASTLAMAVRALALADHPPSFNFQPQRQRQGPAAATVGFE
jgi:hypothetical protein